MSEKSENIAKAYVKVWGKIETPKHNAKVKVKKKNGGEYSFEYTDLKGILDAAREPLIENDLSVMQNAYTTWMDGVKMVSVETVLMHSSGEHITSDPLTQEASGTMQDIGGIITYLRRYSLSAMLGIATEKDDDANGALGNEVTFVDKNAPKQNTQQNKPNQNNNQPNQNNQPSSNNRAAAPPPNQNNTTLSVLMTGPQKKKIEVKAKEYGKLAKKTEQEVYRVLEGKFEKPLDALLKQEASKAIDQLEVWIKKHKETYGTGQG